MLARRWRARWLAIACLCLITLPAVATRPHTADEIEYFSFVRSLWFDRDVSFDNEYRYFADHRFTTDPGFRATFLDVETPTGLRPTFATIGAALLWLPFYAVTDAGVRVARALGATMPADGFSAPYLTAVAWASTVYGWLALALSVSVARQLGGRGAEAAVAVAVGTPLLFYMYAQPGFAHACSAFVVALFVWTWMRVRTQWSVAGVATLAAIAALMTMVREQDAFIVIGPAADYAASVLGKLDARALRAALVRLAVAAGAFAVCFIPQAWAYLTINGHLGPSPVVANKMVWTAPWAMAVVFSPSHGWLAWTPLVAVALAGLIAGVVRPPAGNPRLRTVAVFLLVVVASQVYVSGSVATWTLAGAFGQRRFVGLTVCLVVGVAWLLARAAPPVRRFVVVPALVLAAWWNLGLAFQFGERSMDRQRLEPLRNARTTFLDLPGRVPAIVYRYLFARGSFYAAPTEP
jgi:hypothetical protein